MNKYNLSTALLWHVLDDYVPWFKEHKPIKLSTCYNTIKYAFDRYQEKIMELETNKGGKKHKLPRIQI